MTQQLSHTIAALRTILCMQIVFLHMRITALTPQDIDIQAYPAYYYLATFATLLCRLAVPLFFTISGYLYFQTFILTRQCYVEKTKRRIRHLLQPIFIWTSLYLLLYLAAQNTPHIESLFSGNNKLIADYNGWDVLDAYTGLFSGIPFAGQYWFLRNLLIACLLSPVFWYVFKYARAAGIVAIGIFWYLQPVTQIDASVLNTLFFFSLGGYLGYLKSGLLFPPALKKGVYIGAAVSLPATFFLSVYGSPAYLYMYNLYIVVGMAALFLLCFQWIKKGYGKRLVRLSYGSYFCFLFHQQLLMFLKRGVYKVVHPHDSLMLSILYFVIPVLTICICYGLYGFLKKKFPRILDLLTGEDAEKTINLSS